MMKHVSSILAFVALCCVCTGSAFAAQDGVWPLQTRIDEIAAKGGGTLVLTAGEYHTGAIFFKPGVNLHLEKGATIIGVDDAEGYPMRETRIEGDEWIWEFAIPEGATALVAIPGDTEPQEYTAGAYTVKRHLLAAGNPFSAITSPGT